MWEGCRCHGAPLKFPPGAGQATPKCPVLGPQPLIPSIEPLLPKTHTELCCCSALAANHNMALSLGGGGGWRGRVPDLAVPLKWVGTLVICPLPPVQKHCGCHSGSFGMGSPRDSLAQVSCGQALDPASRLCRLSTASFPSDSPKHLGLYGPGKVHTTASWTQGLSQLADSLPGRASAAGGTLTVHQHSIVSSSVAGSLRPWLSGLSCISRPQA